MTEDEYILVSSLQAISAVRSILHNALPLDDRMAPVTDVIDLMRTLSGWQTTLEGLTTKATEDEDG